MNRKLKMSVIAIFIALTSMCFATESGVAIKLGMAVPSKVKESATTGNSAELDTKTEMVFSLETDSMVAQNFYMGAGLTIEPEVSVTYKNNTEKLGCSWNSIYGLVKAKSDKIYGILKLGIGLLNTSDSFLKIAPTKSGGVYYALGAGMEFENNMLLEADYSGNNASYSGSNLVIDIAYTKLTLNVGYRF